LSAPAVFLDRDGVLIRDVHLLSRVEQIQLLPGVPGALERLRNRGFVLVMVSNQPVVGRGVCDEDAVRAIHDALQERILAAGGPRLDRLAFCPHHPHAERAAYRQDCDCRKPAPGMLLEAARELELDLARSWMVGDRVSDIGAGAAAGCRTVLVETGAHLSAPIVSRRWQAETAAPDHRCADLSAAVEHILGAAPR
jgi:D-glycero-D-manno-heptose 1,7-bisphosphate phosphatase